MGNTTTKKGIAIKANEVPNIGANANRSIFAQSLEQTKFSFFRKFDGKLAENPEKQLYGIIQLPVSKKVTDSAGNELLVDKVTVNISELFHIAESNKLKLVDANGYVNTSRQISITNGVPTLK